MRFVWAGKRDAQNQNLKFVWQGKDMPNRLTIAAADFFRVYVNGKFIAYGPERAPAKYARLREIVLCGAEKIEIYVSAYNVACYCCDLQLPYFAATLTRDGKTIAETTDFTCYEQTERRVDVPRYSFQRGFLEVYDYRKNNARKLQIYSVDSPRLMKSIGDTASYETVNLQPQSTDIFTGFKNRHIPWWYKKSNYQTPQTFFNIESDFLEEVRSGYIALDYELPSMKTGFLRLDIKAEEEVKIFAVFEEILVNGVWVFGRSNDNDVVHWIIHKGNYTVWTAEPYAIKHLKLLVKGKATVKTSIVLYENSSPSLIRVEGNEKISLLINAAETTFRQNAVDIFTDCPGRERAGWLCDSYFTALAERLFFGNNQIEQQFLENIILAETDDIDEGMLPKCFPAEQQSKDDYIINWAMWFLLELEEYQKRTGDGRLAALAKEKIEKLLSFFERYENEYGLLENIEKYIFVEWSVSNSEPYICGVNFPTNMLYVMALESVSRLYGKEDLREKAERLRLKITELSYDGEFFADNAVRIDGKLTRQNENVSETCQYYALFSGCAKDNKFKKKMITEFGPLRDEQEYPHIGRSNMFIGNYLRYFWLSEEKEYGRIIDEGLEYFSKMAMQTGTLWEHDKVGIGVSCNHGFASVAAVLFIRALTGYLTTENGKPVFDESFCLDRKFGAKITFLCADGNEIVKYC